MMKNVYSVGQVNTYIKNMFAQDFMMQRISVKGEVSNCKYHSSGHIYFTLKDTAGTINAIMFAGNRRGLSFQMKEGDKVIVTGSVEVYERDGKYQLYAREIELDGAGNLYLKFEALKKELEEMGMFAPEYKKRIPTYIRRLGIVTAPTGAAVQDIRNISARRNPYVQLILYPALVQGEGAVSSIVNGIRALDALGVDVIIVGRGGGSIEDLWAFNEESVARAIFASELPVISAVGHETDFTIADFVSDLRAPTPSAAAELATTRLADKKEDARALAERLERDMQAVLTVSKRRLEFLKERPVLKRPLELMQKKERVLAEQERLLYKETAGQLQRLSRGLLAAEGRLAAVSPFSVMNRGYAMLMDEGGTPLTTAQAAKVGQAVRIRMKDGILQAEVTGKAVFADGEKETNL